MLKESQLKSYSNLLYKKTGISISDSKKETFEIKIQKLMRRNNISSYDEYFSIISNEENKDSIQEFINTITTNTTQFFREIAHFEYIEKNIGKILADIPRIQRNREIRVWCAASSTGQEPVTAALVLRQCLGEDINIKILATDISSNVLKKAMKGFYSTSECEGIPKHFLQRYFLKANEGYQLKSDILKLISYRYFNLINNFSFKNNFDIVLCRNVMIYFNNSVQETLINKIYDNLVSGGLLFIGHSESLVNKKHSFKFIGPSIYKKP
jgi:chemotaxis protein methyltransferase CheR